MPHNPFHSQFDDITEFYGFYFCQHFRFFFAISLIGFIEEKKLKNFEGRFSDEKNKIKLYFVSNLIPITDAGKFVFLKDWYIVYPKEKGT